MKKALLVIGLALAAGAANAQWFVGGNIGLDYQSADYGNIYFPQPAYADYYSPYISGKDYCTSTFGIQPIIGYIINDKVSAGVSLTFQTKTENLTYNNIDYIADVNTFGIAPFVRYNFLSFGKFNLNAEATLGYLANSGINYKYKRSGVTTQVSKGDKTTIIGLSMSPVVSYNLSNKISLNTYLNFFNLSFLSQSTKPDGGERINASKFSFGLSGNELFTTGAITVGAVYQF